MPESWEKRNRPSKTYKQLTFDATVCVNGCHRAVKKLLSGRLMINSRRLWNSHQRHKLLRAEASRDVLEFRVSETPFPGVFKKYFSTANAMLLCQNTRKTGNNAVEMFQAFHDMVPFKCFTGLNLFKYVFNVIQKKGKGRRACSLDSGIWISALRKSMCNADWRRSH